MEVVWRLPEIIGVIILAHVALFALSKLFVFAPILQTILAILLFAVWGAVVCAAFVASAVFAFDGKIGPAIIAAVVGTPMLLLWWMTMQLAIASWRRHRRLDRMVQNAGSRSGVSSPGRQK